MNTGKEGGWDHQCRSLIRYIRLVKLTDFRCCTIITQMSLVYRIPLLIIISSRESNIHHRPQTFPIFNREPKEPKRVWRWRRVTFQGDFAYPKPSQATSADAALVIIRPYVSIIGRIPAMAIDMKIERNALISCYYFSDKSPGRIKPTDVFTAIASALLECIRSTM